MNRSLRPHTLAEQEMARVDEAGVEREFGASVNAWELRAPGQPPIDWDSRVVPLELLQNHQPILVGWAA